VLDVNTLGEGDLHLLAEAYDNIKSDLLYPLPTMAHDEVRRSLDAAIQFVFQLPSLDTLRALLAQEPVICNRPLGRITPETDIETAQFEFSL
jgi:hypothetical protein